MPEEVVGAEEDVFTEVPELVLDPVVLPHLLIPHLAPSLQTNTTNQSQGFTSNPGLLFPAQTTHSHLFPARSGECLLNDLGREGEVREEFGEGKGVPQPSDGDEVRVGLGAVQGMEPGQSVHVWQTPEAVGLPQKLIRAPMLCNTKATPPLTIKVRYYAGLIF